MPHIRVKPVVDIVNIRMLCVKPYPNHPRGCPNFFKKKGCPPTCPTIDKTLDLAKPVYAIYNIFDFKAHTDKMRKKHPEWTQRQVECCLYWQGTARKQLKAEIKKFLEEFPGMKIVDVPEAQGVNLTETMKRAGIRLEWPPVNVTYQIALAGYRTG